MSVLTMLDTLRRVREDRGQGDDTGRVSMASFFERFTPQEVARISAAGRHSTLPQGWSPIWEQTPADKAYVLLNGTVSVRNDGKEVAQIGPGEIFGEAAIVRHTLRTAQIVALTPLEVIHFTADAIRELIDEMPNFEAALEEIAKSRLG